MSEPKTIQARYPVVVNLTYFKPSGKFYSEASFVLEVDWVNPGLPYMYEIFQHVRDLMITHELPGLAPGSWDGMIHVACADGLGYPGIIKAAR